MGRGLGPFPYILIFPQDEHEQFLIERLAERGIAVERGTGSSASRMGTERAGPAPRSGRVRGRMRGGIPRRMRRSAFDNPRLAADRLPGRHLRSRLLRGGRRGKGPLINHELHAALDDADFLAVFPMKGEERARLIGTVRWELDERREALTWDDVGKGVIDRLRLTVDRVNWFSTYRVHHRVADRFRQGRLSPRRCGPHPQPRGSAGHEHGHCGCGQPCLEARRNPAGAARGPPCWIPTSRSASRSRAGGDHRPGLHGRDQPHAPRPLHSNRRRAAGPAAPRRTPGAFRRFMFRTVSQRP